MLNTWLNALLPEVQLNSPPEIWATAEQGPVSPRKSAKSIWMRALGKSGSPLISMLNTRLNAQVPEVQFDSANVPPEI